MLGESSSGWRASCCACRALLAVEKCNRTRRQTCATTGLHLYRLHTRHETHIGRAKGRRRIETTIATCAIAIHNAQGASITKLNRYSHNS